MALVAEQLRSNATAKAKRQRDNKLRFATLKQPTFGYDGSVIEVKELVEGALKQRLPRLRS